MHKKGEEYEYLTFAIYQSLLREIPNAMVEIHKRLKDRSGIIHEIDIYAEIPIGPHRCKTAIECKDYNNKVGLEKIESFLTVIREANIDKGIYITKVGFTRGAKKLAKSIGIDLLELREPTERDWDGRVKKIIIKMRMYIPEIYGIHFKTSRKDLEGKSFSDIAGNVVLVREDGSAYKTLGEIIGANMVNDWTEKPKEVSVEFEKSLYLKIDGDRVPVSELDFCYRFRASYPDNIVIDGEKTVQYILRDVFSGKIATIDKNKKTEFKG